MNKKILAAAVAAGISAFGSQAQAVTVYSNDTANLDLIGRLKIAYVNNEGANNLGSDHRLMGTARLGVDGRTQVNDIFSVYGQLLYDLNAEEDKNDSDKRIKVRFAYVGFDFNDYGKLQFGRSYDAFYEVYAPVDQYDDWGAAHVGPDYDGRVDGLAMYKIDYNGFKGGVSYRFKDKSKYVDFAVGGYLGYEFDFGIPVGLLAGYNHTKYLAGHTDGNVETSKRDQIGATVYAGAFGEPGFYGAVSYVYAKVPKARRNNGVEGIIAYTTPGADWTFSASYGWMDNSSKTLTRHAYGSGDGTFNEGVTAQINYNITSNFLIHTEYAHASKSVSYPNKKEDWFQFGFIYNF